MNKPIHIWVPGICEGAGGIQAFSRFFVQAVHRTFPNAPIRVLVKNDCLPPDDPLLALPVQFHSVGFLPEALRTTALLSLGLTLGLMDRPRLTLCTHVHFLPALTLLRWFTGARCATVLHGIEAWDLAGKTRINALRSANEIIAVSRHTAEQVIGKFGVDAARVRIVPNTFDTGRFSPAPKPARLLERFHLDEKQPVLLTVSRLLLSERYKGHRQVLAALPALLREWPDLRYIIVGEGDEKNVLMETVRAQGLESHVIFAGYVPGNELLDYYRLCDVFIMPSAKEGFGIVFLEAMACGKPVIAGNKDGSVDALDDGRLGQLVDPSDPAEISLAVSGLLKRTVPNPLWLDPMRLAQEVTHTFGMERVTALLAEVLKHIPKGCRDTDAGLAPSKPVKAHPSIFAHGKHPRVAVITQFTSPYHIELFNEIARQWECQLDVIYLTSHDPARCWTRPLIGHPYLILDQSAGISRQAQDVVANADLCVFNYYTHLGAQRLLRQRVTQGLPWCFWGERPGVFRLGPLGRWFRQLVLRPLHKSKAAIWGVGQFGMQGYLREFGNARNYSNVPYFSNLSRFGREQTQPATSAQEKVFLYSGVLSRRKGADLVARAFAAAAKGRTDMRLLIMGEGRLEPLMKKLLAPVAEKVAWIGFQDWDDLPAFYQKAHYLCAPSRYDGWGLAIVEGLASGLPVLSTNCAGAAVEFVQEGVNGWITPAGDCAALTEAMRRAASTDETTLCKMSRAARESVREHTLANGAARFAQAALEAIAQGSGTTE